MKRRSIAWLVPCLLVLSAASPAVARTTSGLAATLKRIVSEAALGEGVSVAVVNASSGDLVFSYQADAARNPASNAKLLTSAAVLQRMGPDRTLLTGLYGRMEQGAIVGGLALRGLGDPTLSLAHLDGMARELAARGVDRVDELFIDASYFDDKLLPPAFEQQPDEVAPFRAAVSAVAIDRAAYALRVAPGAAPGKPALVSLDAPGYFELENALTTVADGPPKVVADQRALPDGRLKLRLSGPVPVGLRGLTYWRRVENPAVYAGYALIAALARQGIAVPERARLGLVPSGAPLLASHRSAPVGELLHDVGKHSDNFVAEMLLKGLGAEVKGAPGSSARGVAVLLEGLKAAGADGPGLQVRNGSGLFDANRVSPNHLVRLLHHIYREPALRSEYLAHLAVGGRDGTLARRLRELPWKGVVRAKTGTLADVVALSGYVLGPKPGQALAFSVLCNGVRGKVGAARKFTDAVATALAEELWNQ